MSCEAAVIDPNGREVGSVQLEARYAQRVSLIIFGEYGFACARMTAFKQSDHFFKNVRRMPIVDQVEVIPVEAQRNLFTYQNAWKIHIFRFEQRQ